MVLNAGRAQMGGGSTWMGRLRKQARKVMERQKGGICEQENEGSRQAREPTDHLNQSLSTIPLEVMHNLARHKEH